LFGSTWRTWGGLKPALPSVLAPLAIVACGLASLGAQAPTDAPAIDVIRAAVVERLGPDVEITITPLSVPAEPTAFRSATPDPSAWLGKPIRFSLATGAGRTISAMVEVHAVGEYATANHSISRGQVLKADDVSPAKSELKNVPLRKMPTAEALVGAKTLRPLEVGVPVQASFVQLKRVVEPGDKVTVVAGAGAIEVTATLVAADGGDPGDVIRLVNPDTRRYIRGRIVRAGIVEVMHDR